MILRKAGILAMGLLTAISAFFSNCKPAKEITSFEVVTLREVGTAAWTDEWEFVRTETGVTFTYYSGPWEFQEDVTREEFVEKRVEGGEEFLQEVLKLFNDCRISAWDGFRKSNPNVLDGTMFSFKGVINDGEEISASGSNSYPGKYRDFKEAIRNLVTSGTIKGE